jgi:hypothetical protein
MFGTISTNEKHQDSGNAILNRIPAAVDWMLASGFG